MKYLLDTNIVSEPLKTDPAPGVLTRIAAHGAELALAAISWHELLFGLHRLPPGPRRDQVRAYLDHRVRPTLPILAFDASAAEWQALERARLTGIGRTPAYADAQIAAIAVTNGLVLVTRNTKDFEYFEGLALENWFADPA